MQGESYVEIKGRFPHGRYLSFNSYKPPLAALDAIADYEIEPDPGSTNPFRPDADRTVRNRSYTVRVVNKAPPESAREANTLYGGGSGFAGFVLRVYKPDRGLDASGGVGLPTLTLVAADGTRTPIPQCPDTPPLDQGLNQVEANAGVGLPPPGTGLAFRNPPRWHKFTNNVSLMTDLALDNDATQGAVADPLTDEFDARLRGRRDRRDEPQQLRLYGLLARPRAGAGAARKDARRGGHVRGESRRWGAGSLATGRSAATAFRPSITPASTTRASRWMRTGDTRSRCRAPRRGRPRLRRAVAWAGSRAASGAQTHLFVRHLLASPDFAEALQNVEPGNEEVQMGEYYPRGTYYARQSRGRTAGLRVPARRLASTP